MELVSVFILTYCKQWNGKTAFVVSTRYSIKNSDEICDIILWLCYMEFLSADDIFFIINYVITVCAFFVVQCSDLNCRDAYNGDFIILTTLNSDFEGTNQKFSKISRVPFVKWWNTVTTATTLFSGSAFLKEMLTEHPLVHYIQTVSHISSSQILELYIMEPQNSMNKFLFLWFQPTE
jgi:hypothetical protein